MFLKESEIKGVITYTGFHIQISVKEDGEIEEMEDENGFFYEIRKNGKR